MYCVPFVLITGVMLHMHAYQTWTHMYLQALVRDVDNGEIRSMLETVERQMSAVCYISSTLCCSCNLTHCMDKILSLLICFKSTPKAETTGMLASMIFVQYY